ncbi:MAG: N-formylglutamate amidohydrolase, partial [Mesorhizobium sp.]
YKGVPRPWEIGIIHDDDTSLAAPLIAALRSRQGLAVGVNEPYSPADRVYHTLEFHGRRRRLPCAMIEIRNDEISGEEGQQRWAGLLTSIMRVIEPQSRSASVGAVGTQMDGDH